MKPEACRSRSRNSARCGLPSLPQTMAIALHYVAQLAAAGRAAVVALLG